MTHLINKIELSFWDVTIPLLSQSAFVRKSLQNAYTIVQRKLLWGSIFVFSWGALGLVTGFTLGHFKLIH